MKQFLICVLTIWALCACDYYENPLETDSTEREILVYTGITMAEAVFDLVDIFESETACKASVMYGASGYLSKVIRVNSTGDIFFPGNRVYIDQFIKEKIITRTEELGHNKLVFFVQKGNPMNLNGDLAQLYDKRLRVVLGARNAGSVGRETYRLLSQHGIYDKTALNSSFFATDSKGLGVAIREGDADITVNWKASGFLEKNRGHLQVVEINSENIRKVPLVMGLLKYSADTECAGKFLDIATSPAGREIFSKYGFTDK